MITYEDVKKHTWKWANEIKTNPQNVETVSAEMSEFVKMNGNTTDLAWAVREAIDAYYDFINFEIDETTAKMRLSYGAEFFVKHMNDGEAY